MSNEKAIWAQEGNHTMATLHSCASEGVDSLNELEKLELEVIARMCPYLGGSAVYKARVLYSAFNPIMQYNDRLICIQGQNKNGDNAYVNVDSLYEAQTNEAANNMLQLQGIEINTHKLEFIKIATDKFEDILVYPNPARDAIFISDLPEDGEFELSDLLGNSILKQTIKAGVAAQKVLLPVLPNGIYSYKIKLSKNFYSGKLNILQYEK